MSGSWDQRDRKLIDEIKDTIRLHFKGVDCGAWNTDLGTISIGLNLWVRPESYGGILFQNNLPTQTISLNVTPQINCLEMVFNPPVLGQNALLSIPTVVNIPPLHLTPTNVHQIKILPERVLAKHLQNSMAFPSFAIHGVNAAQLKMAKPNYCSPLMLEKFKKPLTYRLPTLKTNSLRFMLQKKPLPIQRKPIPPHRFSTELRQDFREALAQKAGLPVMDIQIVGVYDRIYLALFQSLSQAEDSTLLCIPKTTLDIGASKQQEYTPMYLIFGKSVKSPDKSFRAVLPMIEEKDAP